MSASDRRLFLKYLGAGITGAAAGPALGPIVEAAGPMPFQRAGEITKAATGAHSFLAFAPILSTTADDVVLPPGFEYQVLAVYGDPVGSDRFGYNADFTAFIPTAPDGGEGVLFVNHEYINNPLPPEIGIYQQTFPMIVGGVATIDDEKRDVGASMLHIKLAASGRWEIRQDSRLTRRINATTRMVADGPALAGLASVGGTLGNCSGCHTPWNTVLTCEENYQDYVPEAVDTAGNGTVGGRFNMNGAHFGWVVEVDPLDPGFVPVKHTAMGRVRHENVALRTEANRPVIGYMGHDQTNAHVYKFISDRPYVPGSTANRQVLSSGRLFSAVFNANGTGEWRELALGTRLNPNAGQPAPAIPAGATTLGNVYSNQGAIVTDAYRASNLIGATPSGRPEDIEVHPFDKSVYIAFTAESGIVGDLFENIYGEIWRLVEDSSDGMGTTFTWSRFLAGGPIAGRSAGLYAAPDNLSFDSAGNMWVVCDVSSTRLNIDTRYTGFYKNNGMYFIPTSGPSAGVAMQFASGPRESELTGPSWTPDERTLFLSVQHPGEVSGMKVMGMPSLAGSNWPGNQPGAPPKPGVVVINRTKA